MKKVFLVLLCIAMVPFLCTSAFAANISFGDNSNYWPTWVSPDTGDNSRDVIGTPDLTGGVANVSDTGILNSVQFNYTSVDPNDPIVYNAGDLFIDLSADGTWDYVADVSSNNVLKIVTPLDVTDHTGNNYILTDTYFPRTLDRDGHPVELNTDNVATTVAGSFSNTDFTHGLDPIVFSNLGIDTNGMPLIIGFAPTCANDVIYERVPEPSAALFLGGILFGLGALGRRRFLKR